MQSQTDSPAATVLLTLYIQNMAGDLLALDISPDVTVIALKNEIFKAHAGHSDFAPMRQKLLLLGAEAGTDEPTVLANARQLASYAALVHECTVHLFVTPLDEVPAFNAARIHLALCNQRSEALDELLNEAGGELDLRAYTLDDATIALLAGALQRNATVAVLRVRGACRASVAALADMCRRNCSIHELDVADNEMRASPTVAVATALQENVCVRALDVSGNQLGDAGAAAVVTAVAPNARLATLIIDRDSIGAQLCSAVRSNMSLTSLSLRHNHIDAVCCTALAAMLADNASLTALHVDDNTIGSQGAALLSTALKKNRSLHTLSLRRNGLHAAGAASLASALKQNATLTLVDMAENSIGNAGASSLAQVLQYQPSLTEINLTGNLISAHGSGALEFAVSRNTTLLHVHIEHATIAMQQALSRNRERVAALQAMGENF